jgi:hypothetical protein
MVSDSSRSPASPMRRFFNPYLLTPDRYEVYAEFRRDAPLFYCEEFDVWVVARYSDVQAITRDWETFSHASGVDLDGMDLLMFGAGDFLEQDPPLHRTLRDVVKRRFTPKAIGELEDFIRLTVRDLIAELGPRGEVELLGDFARPIPLIVVAQTMGLPREDMPEFERWVLEIFHRVPGEPEIPQSALATAAEVRSYLAEHLRVKAKAPGDDILSDIARAEVDGILTGEEAVGMAMLMFTAGAATTFGLISNSLLLLAQHPDQRAALIADPTLIPRAVEEVLRFESPLQHSFRTTTREVEMHGQLIPEGQRVLMLFGSANRDEERWADPDRFDVEREQLRHLAFGEGIHHCLGAPLARPEARIALEEFLPAFPDYRIDETDGELGLSTHPTRHAIQAVLAGR